MDAAYLAVNYAKDETAAEATATEIRKHGADAVAIRADVSQPEQVVRHRRLSQSGEIDIVVANAGLEIIDQAISDATEEQFDRLLAGNS